MAYRKRYDKDIWHWRSDCFYWPMSAYVEMAVKPDNVELCTECMAKEYVGKTVIADKVDLSMKTTDLTIKYRTPEAGPEQRLRVILNIVLNENIPFRIGFASDENNKTS